MRRHIIIAIVLFCACSGPAHARDFDPAVDGWRFENWGESGSNCVGSCELSWDLFRKAYLGINPTQNCVEAPLDCAFYEIFKNCAQQGNCGGMSLLSLALFKYGGYMGFCSPAIFYTGTAVPDRDDLHQAINILQARQFSAAGIENLIDTVDANEVNNAVVAFNKARDGIASGDYPVLSIANSALGDVAHTVIPYRTWEPTNGGYPKFMYLWDSVVSSEYDPDHYQSNNNALIINSPTDWKYVQSTARTYSGSGGSGAWCFAVPMSVVLPKSRQPLALDMVFDALMTIFVSGTGAAASQVSDDEGHQLYKTDADTHLLRSDFETDPAKRLRGVVRWPWYAAAAKPLPKPLPAKTKPLATAVPISQTQGADQAPGELYFIRRPAGSTGDLNVTITGAQYQATLGGGGNLIRIEATSAVRARDVITVSRLASGAQSMVVRSLAAGRVLNIRQVRADTSSKDWRSIELKNLKLTSGVPVTIDVVGNMESVVVSSRDQAVSFDADIQQRIRGQLTTKTIPRITTTPGKFLEIAPTGSRILEKSQIRLLDVERARVRTTPTANPTAVK
jgi:hypothetical protein